MIQNDYEWWWSMGSNTHATIFTWAISTNPKPKIYRNLHEYMDPGAPCNM